MAPSGAGAAGLSPDSAITTGANSLAVGPGSPQSLPRQWTPTNKPQLQRQHHSLIETVRDWESDETDVKEKEKERDNQEHSDLPRTSTSASTSSTSRFIKDPDGPQTHDATTVDVVTVPCPGGDALKSWTRDGLISRYFGAPSMRDAEVERQGPAPSWVRQGIRREADVARILLYSHPDVDEGTTLSDLASALLEELRITRSDDDGNPASLQRPIIFIGHSIGGLVVKMALAKAARDTRYEDILRDCYGVAFFGTPHQGSSYFAIPGLASSIQSLLQLSKPLPTSITNDLRVGNHRLIHADEDFKAIAHDLRVWTMYETIDSKLSSGADAKGKDKTAVYFTAPLTSIKSAILGMRQERIFPLQSDHANVASFGRHNTHTLRLFLHQLGDLIGSADASVRDDDKEGYRWTLNLEQRVTIEVHGFFEDPPAANEQPVIRAWSTRLPLAEFLRKGPETCLTERLDEVEGVPEEGRFLRTRGKTMSMSELDTHRLRNELETQEGLGIRNQLILQAQVSPPLSPVLRPIDALPRSSERTRSPQSLPDVIGNRRLSPPPPGKARRISTPLSTPMYRPSPLIRADFEQDLATDRLSPPLRPRSVSVGRSISDQSSRLEYRDFPPFSQHGRSRSTTGVARGDDDRYEIGDDSLENSPALPESVVAIRKEAKNKSDGPTDETVIVDEVPAAFVKPDVSTRKFVWVHVPHNNPAWAKKIIETLQVCYKKDFSALCDNDFWSTKHTRGRHSQHYAYFTKPGCYFTAPRTLSPRSHTLSPSMSPLAEDALSICLFLPYLHFDSYKRLVRRRNVILRRLNRGRARPIPADIAKSDSMELQVIWEYLGHDPPINCRRTLDQYGYPSLRDTRGRDDDQMLYKLTKERLGHPRAEHRGMYVHSSNGRSASYGSGSSWKERMGAVEDMESEEGDDDGILNGNVLMVDQLWVWVINSHTLLSFFPKRESDPIEGPLYQQADLRDSIFNEVNVDLTRQCDNALDLAALAALHAVSVLLDRASHPDLEVFRIFEEAISVLTEKLTNSLKAFRVEGFRDKASDHEPDEAKERSIRARHKEEGRRTERENRDNTSALLELRDLEDELLVLLGLFERQHAVLTSMLAAFGSPQLRDKTINGRAFLSEAIRRVGEYKRRAEEMGMRVRSTRDDYDKLLQMVQRQAQVDEVRLSRLHADLASAQSRSIMIFTIFTVIFLPLTFFTALFGMNTREWDANVPTLGFIGAVSIPSSVGLIAISLIAAFSTHARQLLRGARNLIGAVLSWTYYRTVQPVIDMTYYPLVDRIQRRRAAMGRNLPGNGTEGSKGSFSSRDARRGGVKKEASDFWERNRLERDMGYEIPEVNKKKSTAGRKRSSAARTRKLGGSQ